MEKREMEEKLLDLLYLILEEKIEIEEFLVGDDEIMHSFYEGKQEIISTIEFRMEKHFPFLKEERRRMKEKTSKKRKLGK